MVHHLSSKKLEVIITLLFVFILSSFPPSDSLLSPIIPKFYSKIIRKVEARENNQSNNLLTIAKMGKEDELFTTSAEDQAAVAKLKERISKQSATTNINHNNNDNSQEYPSVTIDEGVHKYVLIVATKPTFNNNNNSNNNTENESNNNTTYFVTSKRGASYHYMAADPLVSILETRGYTNIQVLGGGRISRDDDSKIISIFGYSYGFGRADHAKSKEIIEADERFGSYNVKWSNEGY